MTFLSVYWNFFSSTSPLANSKDSQEGIQDCIYLCGHSLGLQPKITRKILNEELNVWAER